VIKQKVPEKFKLKIRAMDIMLTESVKDVFKLVFLRHMNKQSQVY
jgi:hypothetical protein